MTALFHSRASAPLSPGGSHFCARRLCDGGAPSCGCADVGAGGGRELATTLRAAAPVALFLGELAPRCVVAGMFGRGQQLKIFWAVVGAVAVLVVYVFTALQGAANALRNDIAMLKNIATGHCVGVARHAQVNIAEAVDPSTARAAAAWASRNFSMLVGSWINTARRWSASSYVLITPKHTTGAAQCPH